MTKTPNFFDGPADDTTRPSPADPWSDPETHPTPWANTDPIDTTPAATTPTPPTAAPQNPDPQWPTDQQAPGHQPDHDLPDANQLLRRKPVHASANRGWRKWVAKSTGERINPGPSAKQERADELVSRIRASLLDVHKVAFINFKGGVGKTTMTVGVGNAIARIRGDRVIAVDTNTDMGNLATRFAEDGGPTANIEALSGMQAAERYSSVRVHTVQNSDRLEALGAQSDPRSSYTLGSRDYTAAMNILELHYNVILVDYGTSITAPLFSTIANDITSLVVVGAQNYPGHLGTITTLKWLQAHGFGRLLEHTVVALNATQPGSPLLQLDAAEAEIRQYGVTDIVRIPYDPHLAQGIAVDFDRLKPKTRKALMNLAGAVADHYPARQPARHRATTEDAL